MREEGGIQKITTMIIPIIPILQGNVSFDANGIRAGRRPLVNQYRHKGELQFIYKDFLSVSFGRKSIP